MPEFTFDISQYAQDYVTESIKGMPGNAGQETLVADLDIGCSCDITVYISGPNVYTEGSGSIQLYSNHPEAIEQIIAAAEDNFDEFVDKLSRESFAAYAGLDIIETIRQDSIDEAFKSL